MATFTDQPTNPNFLSQIGFKFFINKTPNINYFIQQVNLPGVSLGTSDFQTPFSKIPIAGDRLAWDDLSIVFKVDEDLKNYVELYNWLIAVGFPDNFDQFQQIENQTNGPISGTNVYTSGQGIYSDATLMILSSAMNPLHQVNFIDCYPFQMGGLEFNATDTDVNYLTCQASFRYRRFTIKTL